MKTASFFCKVEKTLGFKFACELHEKLSSSGCHDVEVIEMLKKALKSI